MILATPHLTDPDNVLAALRAEAMGCRACPLWEGATQTVFGHGPAPATIMLVGEQPGDKEDLAGLPFVGPAGQMLDRGLAEAGIDRETVYVTNAVKHFKFLQRGKIRLHQKPVSSEIRAATPGSSANWQRWPRVLSSPWARLPRNRFSARQCRSDAAEAG